MATREAKPDRLTAFSDGVFAVVITILVLEMKPPQASSFESLVSLWPTWVSYAVSYLFIAIVWINHHHVMSYARMATARLLWSNFGHLFAVSLLPFSTAWDRRHQARRRPCVSLCERLRVGECHLHPVVFRSCRSP